MKFSSFLATSSLLAVTALSHSASAAPAWCKGAHFDRAVQAEDLAHTEPKEVIETLASATCAPNDSVSANAAAIEQSRQAWGKRLGMEDADWADVITWIAANEGRDTKLEYASKDATKFSPIDQYIAITTKFHDKGGAKFRDWMYTADAFDPQLSEVGRLGAIKACLSEADEQFKIVPFALCQGDIDAFDQAKFNAQLRADTSHPGDRKMELRFAMLDASVRLKQQPAKVAAAVKEDPAYKKMFDIAAKARADWASGIGKDKDLLALVLKMDSAVWSESRSQHEGCEAPTAAAVSKAAANIAASSLKGLKGKAPKNGENDSDNAGSAFIEAVAPIIVDNAELSLAAVAYLECDGDRGLGRMLGAALASTVNSRGPRSLALQKILGASLQLDDASAAIRWPTVLRAFGGGSARTLRAVVGTAKIEGNVVTITAPTTKSKELECVASHKTNRIYRIQDNGVLEYEEVCDKSAMVDRTNGGELYKLRKEYAPLLGKGVVFVATYGGEGGADLLAAWSDAKSEAPSWFLGAKVK